MTTFVVEPLPQSTMERLLTTVAVGYGLSPVQTVVLAKSLERMNVPSVVSFEVRPAPSA